MQHGNAVGDRQHPVDVVLDQQHRMALRQTLDQVRDDDAVRLGEAGKRLVEQQQLRLDRQRHRDFE